MAVLERKFYDDFKQLFARDVRDLRSILFLVGDDTQPKSSEDNAAILALSDIKALLNTVDVIYQGNGKIIREEGALYILVGAGNYADALEAIITLEAGQTAIAIFKDAKWRVRIISSLITNPAEEDTDESAYSSKAVKSLLEDIRTLVSTYDGRITEEVDRAQLEERRLNNLIEEEKQDRKAEEQEIKGRLTSAESNITNLQSSVETRVKDVENPETGKQYARQDGTWKEVDGLTQEQKENIEKIPTIEEDVNTIKTELPKKLNYDGYSQLARVGLADNLTSRGIAQDVTLTSRVVPSDVAEGNAVVQSIKGNSVIVEGKIINNMADGVKTTDLQGNTAERLWKSTREKYFPDGLAKVGDVADEMTSTKAVKRIDIRAYQSGDESNPEVVTDMTNTLYKLATPEETEYDELNLSYPVTPNGMEEMIAEGDSAPLPMSVVYGKDAYATILKNEDNIAELDTKVEGNTTAITTITPTANASIQAVQILLAEKWGISTYKVGVVNMGTLSFSIQSGIQGLWRSDTLTDINETPATIIGKLNTIRYKSRTANDTYTKHIGISVNSNVLWIYDDTYPTAEALTLSLRGIYLFYEKA